MKKSLLVFCLLFLTGCRIQKPAQQASTKQPIFTTVSLTKNYQPVDATLTKPVDHSYFSFDPDVKRNRVSVTGSVFFFVDGNNDLYTITDGTDAKVILSNVVEVTQNAPEYFAVTSDGSLWSWSDGYYGC